MIDGTAFNAGVVHVVSTDGYGGSAPLNEAGAFHFAGGLPPGTYCVWLEPSLLLMEAPAPDAPLQASEREALIAQERSVKAFNSRVPRPYRSQLTTPLTVTVTEGQTELPIEITK